jgi:integrase
LNDSADRRHDRRALTDDEFKRLVVAAKNGAAVEAVSGIDRAMIYVLAAWTGYRRGELASLTLRSFDLDSETPCVRLKAANSKNRQQGEIPLHPVVVERLRSWIASRPTTKANIPLLPLLTASGKLRKTAKMMKRDLASARSEWLEEAKDDEAELERRTESDFLTYCDDDGLFADFHANRHTFISNLGRAGVPLATAQKLARHADPKLTANVYCHFASETVPPVCASNGTSW